MIRPLYPADGKNSRMPLKNIWTATVIGSITSSNRIAAESIVIDCRSVAIPS